MKSEPLPLLAFIAALTPSFQQPTHLAPLADLFERASAGEAVHATASVPPRHGKTELEKHAIVRYLLQCPDARVGFASYSAAFARKKSREIMKLYERAGGSVARDARSKEDWRTGIGDGGLWAGGVEGAWTGEGFNLLVVDDPIKDRARAESPVERQKLTDWHNDSGYTRLEPHGSEIVIHHRWTTDDLIARLIRDGWENLTLPAIDAEGRALWPARFPIDQLRRIETQLGAYGFASLYQGQPFARGGQLFGGVVFYDSLPVGLRVRIGVDLAYTKKTKSDWSVAVVLGELNGTFYVLDVVRMQTHATEFKRTLDALAIRFPGVRPFTWTGGQEKAVVGLLNQSGGVQIDCAPAVIDKYSRAQPVSAAWNAGRVLLPREAAWLEPFTNELCGFTGADAHDDMVDALAAAHACLRVAYLSEAERERYRISLARMAFDLNRALNGGNGMSFDRVTGEIVTPESLLWRAQARDPEQGERRTPGSLSVRETEQWEAMLAGKGNGGWGDES